MRRGSEVGVWTHTCWTGWLQSQPSKLGLSAAHALAPLCGRAKPSAAAAVDWQSRPQETPPCFAVLKSLERCHIAAAHLLSYGAQLHFSCRIRCASSSQSVQKTSHLDIFLEQAHALISCASLCVYPMGVHANRAGEGVSSQRFDQLWAVTDDRLYSTSATALEEQRKKSTPVGVGRGRPWIDQWHPGINSRTRMSKGTIIMSAGRHRLPCCHGVCAAEGETCLSRGGQALQDLDFLPRSCCTALVLGCHRLRCSQLGLELVHFCLQHVDGVIGLQSMQQHCVDVMHAGVRCQNRLAGQLWLLLHLLGTSVRASYIFVGQAHGVHMPCMVILQC